MTRLHARAGDQLVILSATLGRPVRDGEIIETRGADGSAPFLVRWADNGRTTLVFPGPDARVHSLSSAEGWPVIAVQRYRSTALTEVAT
jgi:hypothetical protein